LHVSGFMNEEPTASSEIDLERRFFDLRYQNHPWIQLVKLGVEAFHCKTRRQYPLAPYCNILSTISAQDQLLR